MVQGTLAAAAGVAVVVAGVYGYVARRVLARPSAQPVMRRALQLFALWWGALAVNIGATSVLYLAAAFGYTDPAVQLVAAHFQRLLLAVSLVGLMGYLGFLLTGRDLVEPLAVFYAGYFVLLLYSLALGRPDGVVVGAWRTDVHLAATTPAVLQLVSFVALVGPPVAASLALLGLSRRMRDASQRYRVVLIAGSLTAWWIVAVVAGQREAAGAEAFQMFNRLFGLVAALAILAAFEPPRWVRVRWGIEPFARTAPSRRVRA
jgi:hypothetical protein